jgi:hypothetical protein
MANFTEKNRNQSITLRSRWALSQYRSYGVGPETPFSPRLKSVSRRLIQVPCLHLVHAQVSTQQKSEWFGGG